MRAYLAIGIQSHQNKLAVIETMRKTLSLYNYKLFVFVEQYQFTAESATEMMQQAFADIDASTIFLAEVSEKAIGVGIEAGYAAARGIPIVYLRHISAEHSTTMQGTAQQTLIYQDTATLASKLAAVLADNA